MFLYLLRVFTFIAITFVYLLTAGCSESEQDVKKLKISLDTGSNHLRNIVLKDFIEALKKNNKTSLVPELYESGQLTKDRDVPKALHWGSIEMAVPAQSKLTRFVPEANLLSLPILYGLPKDIMYSILNGKIGKSLNDAIEKKLAVKILGDYIILGFTSTYTSNKPIREISELKGMKIRVPGGSGSVTLYQQLGVNPLALPISDVPLALAQGNLNGIQSTHETVASTQLWDVGIQYCFEDRANIIVYIPILNLNFWQSLDTKEQQVLSTSWSSVVKNARSFAEQRQLRAKKVLFEKGIECFEPLNEQLETQRRKMSDASSQLAKNLNIPPTLYTELLNEIEDKTQQFESNKKANNIE